MNTANKLTLLRVVMIPAFLLVLYLDVPGASYWALAIFVAASLTDTLDGYIARHYNQVTDFGKFMDPLTANSRMTTMSTAQAGIWPISTNHSMAATTRHLSARGSMNLPKSVTWL